MPKFVTQGTPTTKGGVVLEGHSTILIDGKPATSVNQKATCASGRKSSNLLCYYKCSVHK